MKLYATRKETSNAIREDVRKLKASGHTYREIAKKLNISSQLAHYYGRPAPGERCCPFCIRPFNSK